MPRWTAIAVISPAYRACDGSSTTVWSPTSAVHWSGARNGSTSLRIANQPDGRQRGNQHHAHADRPPALHGSSVRARGNSTGTRESPHPAVGSSLVSWKTEADRLVVAFHFCWVAPVQPSTSMLDHCSPDTGALRPRHLAALSTIVYLVV